MIRFGLIGAGRIGKVHALAVQAVPNALITAVADVVPAAAEALAQQLGAQVVSIEEMFNSSHVDAYIIASSTDTHADYLMRCAEVGKPVFCEKPLDLSYERAQRCSEAVQKAGVPCMLGFNRRFDPQFSTLKQHLQAGTIGKLETLIITSRDPAPPPVTYIKVSGGIFRDMMIHDFDMARWLLDEEPTRVYAVGSALVDPAIGAAGDVDTASVTLSTASGKIAVITNSRRATYGYDQRIEAFGEKGMLQANNQLENTLLFAGTEGVMTAKPQHFFLERYADAYRIELTQFVQALQQDTQMPTTEQDGLQALRLADAAYESWKSGQPVDLT
ncbi:MAG: inositol 2-dehydrogenase [Thiofilum sp.]|uniref:inositol 2-dehydrogenase n=1 Tax=Thiofilum sp. TaxID=2212733 RepID=UPI0025D3FF4B|nr:inositol 2-dehydrogenase [Thiofilum sp.]MBK8452199.1 inositol 2-dehydrogenase [Thiofilum sp.]